MTAVERFLAPSLPPATATDMARRVVAVAEELQRFNIMPLDLTVGLAYIDGRPEYGVVAAQIEAADFVRFVAWGGFDRSVNRSLAYGIGWLHGVPTRLYASASEVAVIEGDE